MMSTSIRVSRPRAVTGPFAVLLACLAAGPVAAVTPSGAVIGPSRNLDAVTPAATTDASMGLSLVKSGFSDPVFVTHAQDLRLLVVEQAGLVRNLRPPYMTLGWRVDRTPFLDIRSRVLFGGERGLLGLAFPPNYLTSGRFFFYYTNKSGNNVVAEGRRDPTNKSRSTWYRDVLTISHPTYSNHNGGMLAFGPSDGYLYIGTGDGGGSGDPGNNAQDLTRPLGKLLRIDVSPTSGYAVPATNPYASSPNSTTRIVWARGLRNPWRFSFDPATSNLWIGDVGQDRYEEVDHSINGKGANYGWRLMEGRHCYDPSTSCNITPTSSPVAEYAHSVSGTDNCSVTGGYVYRGSLYPALVGRYVFGDYCSGRIWNISAASSPITTLPTAYSSGVNMTSFGVAADGELYLTSAAGGVYRVTGY